MARVIHTIKGHKYPYDHKRVGDKVVCTYCGGEGVDGRRTTSDTTRLSNATRQLDNFGNPRYTSQDELDEYIKKSYVRGGLGVRRLQSIFSDELGLHPTRREIENYLMDMGIELRKRKKPAPPEPEIDTIKSKLAQTEQDLAAKTTEQECSDAHIAKMKAIIADTEKEKLRLKEALMDIRDKGRAPTDAEIEKLIL